MSLSQQQRFPRRRASVGAARDFTTRTLTDWGLDDLQDELRLCVSELATNALIHGAPPGREFSVRLDVDGSLVRLEVRDSGEGLPVVRDPDADEETGRGLRLAMTLADECGVIEHVVGKSVWLNFKLRRELEGTG
ncbi:ATP-binding protein [Streptomyces sp. 891-h]|uniref:ATP-binding protein n=1 Tax=unclassified Streptomyces TaxID=2593676 RepID=UPI001FAADFD6|nr:ATP-binding protein [Streptomyces sp. 891-h]UNZ19054.1 ATP-binding protein [Streptomyces sp. 891-h]